MKSKQVLKNEIIACGKDPRYFIKKYVRIRHPIRGIIPFGLFDYQEELISTYVQNRFNVVLKARQMGISEVTAAYAAWLMLFHRDKNILVIATKAETAKNLVKKVRTALTKIPKWLMLADIVVDNKMSLELNNGSVIKAAASSSDAGRSEALSLLIIDEAAFIKNMEELWTGLLPTVKAGGRVIMLSTPNGVGNVFHKTYIEAESKVNDFKTSKLMWWLHPENNHDLEDDPERPGFKTSPWFRKETKNMSAREIAQELECVTFNTKIVTPFGVKEIGDIRVGDEVLTHKGRFRKVLKLFSKVVSKDEIVKVSLPMSRKFPVFITKNHPILSREGWKSFNEDKTRNKALMPALQIAEEQANRQIDMSEFACCIEKTDECVRYNRQRGETNRFVDVDYDFGKFIGLFLAEGYKNGRNISFAFHRDEDGLIEFISTFCKRYGFSHSVQKRDYAKCTVVSISSFFCSSLIDLFVSGKNCYDKILTSLSLSCGKTFLKGAIDGCWKGDGLHAPSTKNVLRLANRNLIYQIRTLMTGFGLFTRVSNDGENSWYIELNNVDDKLMKDCTSTGFLEKKQSRCKFENNLWWGNVKFEEPTELFDDEVDVYNIEVDEDNSYVCENLVVHNCNFNASGDTVISAEQMTWMNTEVFPVASMENWDRKLFVWREFKPGKKYLLCADVARGDGADNSAFHIFDLENMEQVAEYYGQIPIDDFAKLICETGKRYGSCIVVVENVGVGLACLEHIRMLGYPNVYYSRKGDTKPGETVNTEFGSFSDDLIIGFTTSHKTRPLMISKLEEYVRMRTVLFRSKRFLEEIRTFIWNNGRAEAMKGYNDDLIMAAAMGIWLKDTFVTPNFASMDHQRKMLQSISLNKISNTDIKGASKDPRFVPRQSLGTFSAPKNPYQMKTANGLVIDFRELLDGIPGKKR